MDLPPLHRSFGQKDKIWVQQSIPKTLVRRKKKGRFSDS